MKISSCFVFTLFLLLAISLAFAIESSQHETVSKEAKGGAEEKKVEPAGYGGGGGNRGGGGGNWGGGGGGGNWGGGGHGCRHGCCYSGYRGCQRCCASPEEAKALAAETSQQQTMKPEAKEAAEQKNVEPQGYGGGGGNWGGGGGGNWGGGGHGCRHGCCYSGYRGCQRCCASPEEAKALAAETSQQQTLSKEAKGVAEQKNVEPQGYGGGGGNWGGGGGGGRGCRHGCCYSGYRGCQRCCASPEEAKALAAETSQQHTMSKEPKAKGATEQKNVEPQGYGGGGGNWGGGGYRCRHGCCYRGYRGCQKCCASPEEAKALAAKKKLNP